MLTLIKSENDVQGRNRKMMPRTYPTPPQTDLADGDLLIATSSVRSPQNRVSAKETGTAQKTKNRKIKNKSSWDERNLAVC